MRARHEAEQAAAARRRILTHGPRPLSAFGELDPEAFRLFLALLGDALGAMGPRAARAQVHTFDGELTVTLTRPAAGATAVLATPTASCGDRTWWSTSPRRTRAPAHEGRGVRARARGAARAQRPRRGRAAARAAPSAERRLAACLSDCGPVDLLASRRGVCRVCLPPSFPTAIRGSCAYSTDCCGASWRVREWAEAPVPAG